MGTEYLNSQDDHFHERNARKHIVILISDPLTNVEGNGLKTRYSKAVATLKLNIYQTQSNTKAFFQRFDISMVFLMALVTFLFKFKLICT